MSAPHSLVHYIEHWAKLKPHRNALHGKRNGHWYSVSWEEYWASVRQVGKALVALGHREGECVAFVGVNDPRWVQYQFGTQAVRGIPAPIYLTNTKEQSAFIVANSKARILVCDSEAQLTKFLEAEAEGLFPRLEHILTFDEVPRAKTDARVKSFAQVLALGEAQSDAELERRLGAITETETCLLIYTSGTTGTPKGVQIGHGGQFVIGRALTGMYPEMSADGAYHCISYLPLCHQAEQLLTNVCSLMTGGEVSFCPDLQQIKDYLVDVRPTVFLGVPRVWEKFEMALRGKLGQTTGPKAKLAEWCMETELACFDEQLEKGLLEYQPLKRRAARKLVVDTIKKALGLDRLKVAITGSAPIAPSTQRFFASLGITIYEAYGLSETSGAATITDRRKPRFGTVGRAFDGVEIRLSSEGEIQIRGKNNSAGYFHLPEESRAMYDADGWLLTGDLGAFDDERNLIITGRIKELLITAGGKNVAPVEMENHVKSIPGVGHVVVVGDRKPYLVALITLSPETSSELAKNAGVPEGTLAELAANPKVRRYLEDEIERVCNAKVARYQTIKKFVILPHELSVDGGELTATMKLKRKPIVERYTREIATMYEGGGAE
jgi:long-subunit acyl-CoA synthetase (AMP-forming)